MTHNLTTLHTDKQMEKTKIRYTLDFLGAVVGVIVQHFLLFPKSSIVNKLIQLIFGLENVSNMCYNNTIVI